jgi:hypothetical protein
MISIKTYDDKNTIFEYGDVKYKIKHIHPLLEQKRAKLVERIYKKCIDVIKQYIPEDLIKGRHGADKVLETMIARFFMVHLSKNIDDPVIPTDIDSYKSLIRDLDNKLKKDENISKEDRNKIINKIIKELNLNNMSTISLNKLLKYYELNKNLFKERVTIIKTTNNEMITLNYNGDIIDIYNKLYAKVKNAYNNSLDYDLNTLIWCLVKRYMTLKSYNQQLAINSKTLGYLRNNYLVNFELFGSILNVNCSTRCNLYCSMFYDIEKYFGSYGSFEYLQPIKGNFSINPPFDEIIIEKMMDKIIKLLDISKQNELRFFIWIPVWDKKGLTYVNNKCNSKYKYDISRYGTYNGFEKMKNSEYIKYQKIICMYKMAYFNYQWYKKIFATNTYLLILHNRKNSDNNYNKIPLM